MLRQTGGNGLLSPQFHEVVRIIADKFFGQRVDVTRRVLECHGGKMQSQAFEHLGQGGERLQLWQGRTKEKDAEGPHGP